MRTLRRPIAVLLLVWFLPACSAYQTTELAPQEAVAGQQAVKLKLADATSTEVEVSSPWVRADSIGGVVDGDASWSVPLSSVSEIKTKRFSVGHTTAAVLVPLAVAGVAFLVFAYTYDPGS